MGAADDSRRAMMTVRTLASLLAFRAAASMPKDLRARRARGSPWRARSTMVWLTWTGSYCRSLSAEPAMANWASPRAATALPAR